VAGVPTISPGESSSRAPSPGRALFWAAPLLALAVTHCGGKESHGQPAGDEASVGGASVAGASVGGASVAGASVAGASVAGASALGNAGQTSPSIDVGLIDSVGGYPPSECNAVGEISGSIILTSVADNPPTPEGGAISDGLYHLSKLEDFVGPGGGSRYPEHWRASLVVSTSTDVSAYLQFNWEEYDGELPTPVEQNETIVIAGTSYTYTVACTTARLGSESGTVSFTATRDQLIEISPRVDGITRVSTYTRD
jgi:hypothetical protein